MKTIKFIPPPPPMKIIIWILNYLIDSSMMNAMLIDIYTKSLFHTNIARLLTVYCKRILFHRTKKKL